MKDLKPIIETLLFVAEEPLTVDKLNTVLELTDKKEIRTALEELRDAYDNREGGFQLREVAGGWQLRSRPEYHEWIKRMLQPSPQRLSRAALETLAIVAYKQPVIRADIEYIRGVDSGGVLRQLMERKLIRVLGRREIPGRPLIYATTKLFLELFDLKDLKDLPSPKEIEEMSGKSHMDSEPLDIDPTDPAENDSPPEDTGSDSVSQDSQSSLNVPVSTESADAEDTEDINETPVVDEKNDTPDPEPQPDNEAGDETSSAQTEVAESTDMKTDETDTNPASPDENDLDENNNEDEDNNAADLPATDHDQTMIDQERPS